jgi:hypothetical protein
LGSPGGRLGGRPGWAVACPGVPTRRGESIRLTNVRATSEQPQRPIPDQNL